MKRALLASLGLTSLCLASIVFAGPATQPATQPSVKDFGEPLKLAEADTLDVSIVLKDPSKYEGKMVRLTGKISQVCQAAGCWLEMTTPDTTHKLMVKFTCPIEGTLIPADSAGKTAIVEGKVKVTEIDQDTARHYAEDAGATKEQIEAIKGPQQRVKLSSPAARVVG